MSENWKVSKIFSSEQKEALYVYEKHWKVWVGSTRYQKSAIPYMISILNKYESKRSDSLRKISVPMNYDAPVSISLRWWSIK